MNEQNTVQPDKISTGNLDGQANSAAPSTVTVKLPKVNWQMTALILIAVVAAFQTFQLATLKGKVSLKPAAASTGSAASAPAANAGLESMVGGC